MEYRITIKAPDNEDIEVYSIEAECKEELEYKLEPFTSNGFEVQKIEPARKNWGGKRQGAGRPTTGRKKRNFYITDEEAEAIKNLINTMRKSPRA